MCCGHSEHHAYGSSHHLDECRGGHAEYPGQRSMHCVGGCACGGGLPHQFGPVFWSKKKQIRILEQLLEQKRAEVQDLVDLLDELKPK